MYINILIAVLIIAIIASLVSTRTSAPKNMTVYRPDKDEKYRNILYRRRYGRTDDLVDKYEALVMPSDNIWANKFIKNIKKPALTIHPNGLYSSKIEIMPRSETSMDPLDAGYPELYYAV